MTDEEDLRHGYRWQISKDLKLIRKEKLQYQLLKYYPDCISEFCYNMRFFEKNARDKWSLRQMGVYHQYVIDKKESL